MARLMSDVLSKNVAESRGLKSYFIVYILGFSIDKVYSI